MSRDFIRISWEGGPIVDQIIFSVNGKTLGVGAEALAKLMSKLSELDDNAFIVVEYQSDRWNEMTTNYVEDDPFPFGNNEEAKRQFHDFMIKKHLTIQREAK